MRIDFNVLWVDDQPDHITAQIQAIDRHMEEEGFHFNPALCRSPADLDGKIGDQIFNDEVDLVLVDWDLGQQLQGQDVLEAIRERVPYKDVVFYSAQTPVSTLRQLAFEKGIEGVYCASREDLVEEVLGVFESLVKKVLDLDHARGIVMGATSDIDHMVNECLTAMHDLLDDVGRQKMVEDALERINERTDELAHRVTQLKSAPTMAALFEAHMIFTANDRLRILSRLLKQQFKNHGTTRKSVVDYIEQVVPSRNELGHLVLVPEGRPSAVVTTEGKAVSVAEIRQLRRTILAIRADFRTLVLALQDQLPPAT
jgi:CheY-like chemotaxis protein